MYAILKTSNYAKDLNVFMGLPQRENIDNTYSLKFSGESRGNLAKLIVFEDWRELQRDIHKQLQEFKDAKKCSDKGLDKTCIHDLERLQSFKKLGDGIEKGKEHEHDDHQI